MHEKSAAQIPDNNGKRLVFMRNLFISLELMYISYLANYYDFFSNLSTVVKFRRKARNTEKGNTNKVK